MICPPTILTSFPSPFALYVPPDVHGEAEPDSETKETKETKRRTECESRSREVDCRGVICNAGPLRG